MKSRLHEPIILSREIPRSRFSLGMTILIGYSLPGGVNGLADQVLRIRARARVELLHAAAGNFSDVEIAFLVHAQIGRAHV